MLDIFTYLLKQTNKNSMRQLKKTNIICKTSLFSYSTISNIERRISGPQDPRENPMLSSSFIFLYFISQTRAEEAGNPEMQWV